MSSIHEVLVSQIVQKKKKRERLLYCRVNNIDLPPFFNLGITILVYNKTSLSSPFH